MFFVIELADWFGGIFESRVICVDNNLGNDSSDFAVLIFASESIMDGLGEPIADLALTHGDSGFKWHGGSFVGRGLLFVN